MSQLELQHKLTQSESNVEYLQRSNKELRDLLNSRIESDRRQLWIKAKVAAIRAGASTYMSIEIATQALEEFDRAFTNKILK